jgi:hypothetical protein
MGFFLGHCEPRDWRIRICTNRLTLVKVQHRPLPMTKGGSRLFRDRMKSRGKFSLTQL